MLKPKRSRPGVAVARSELATGTYFDPLLDRLAVKVLPGEYHVSADDEVQVTVLGSCVAACIRDPESGVGGMNHFMLPGAGAAAACGYGASARYGAYAMELLINELIKLGARRSQLEAKVFGGGNVIGRRGDSTIGSRNSSFVLEYLALEGIPVVAKDLEDVHARKVYHFLRSGRVRVKKLAGPDNRRLVVDGEDAYRKRIQHAEPAGEVELFS